MDAGIWKTFETLRDTGNRAAERLLVDLCLAGPDELADRSFEWITKNHKRDGLFHLVEAYDQLPLRFQEPLKSLGSPLSFAIRQAYVDQDPHTYANARRLIEEFPAYEQISLVLGSLDQEGERKIDAAQILTTLTEKLVRELAADPSERTVADVENVRRHFIASLEVAFRRFAHHKVSAVPEAMLILADDDSELIRAALSEPSHTCHAPIVDAISTKQNPRITRWIYTTLRWRNIPSAILRIISQRSDPWFIRQLLANVGLLADPAIMHAARAIREIAWLKPSNGRLKNWSEEEQSAMVILAISAGLPLREKLAIVNRVLDAGAPAARVTAICALLPYTGNETNQIVENCLNDKNPDVLLGALRQVRIRHLHGVLAQLMGKLDHPDHRIRAAVRETLLEEYNFERYFRGFDQMDDRTRSLVGATIARIDDRTDDKIRAELNSDHRNHRLRAIRVVQALSRANYFWEEIAEFLSHSDHIIVRAALDTLCHVNRPELVPYLVRATQHGPLDMAAGATEALKELSARAFALSVREAATDSLQEDPILR